MVDDAVILIRISRTYHNGISAQELWEITRGVWRIGPRREGAQYALAVYAGHVVAVYRIRRWLPAGTLSYHTRRASSVNIPGRWEFDGEEAPPDVQAKYLGADVRDYFPRGSQSPFRYVNC